MATLRITFAAASPAPSNGYLIRYRKAGSADTYSTVSTGVSPTDITVPDGFSYEGFISSDCGGGVFSTSVSFTAALSLDACYVYEFVNNGTVNATVYHEPCGSPGVNVPVTVIPLGSGGTTVYTTSITGKVFINITQVPPGVLNGTIDSVSYSRSILV
jgi:hypothetical protein